jgi:hypothetical protein
MQKWKWKWKQTNKPDIELSGSSYFRVIQQFLDIVLLVSSYLSCTVYETSWNYKVVLMSRRKIVSVLFLTVLLPPPLLPSSLAVFYYFSFYGFLSSSKKNSQSNLKIETESFKIICFVRAIFVLNLQINNCASVPLSVLKQCSFPLYSGYIAILLSSIKVTHFSLF